MVGLNPMPRREEHECRACAILDTQISFGRAAMEWRCHMNRLVLLLLYCAAWAAPYARADDAAAMAVLRAGCTADVQRLCANVPPGGGRILACLRQHKDALSDQCKQAAQKAASMSGNAAPSPTSAPPAPSAAATTEPAPQRAAPARLCLHSPLLNRPRHPLPSTQRPPPVLLQALTCS